MRKLWRLGASPLVAVMIVLSSSPCTTGAAVDETRRVLVLYPVSDGQPGIFLHDRGLRTAFRNASGPRIEIYNQYLDAVRFPDDDHQRRLAEFLRDKFAGAKPDLVVCPLAPSLDFALKYRGIFAPGVPVVFSAIEARELRDRRLGPGVAGVALRIDLEATLEQALRFHPGTRRVVVVAGRSRTDAFWLEEARRAFRRFQYRIDVDVLAGLPMNDLLREVGRLPAGSLIYYLHVFEDGRGETFIPAEVVERLSATSSAPVYGHYRTYLGRGIVGGQLADFEAEGEQAARVGLRILGGEKLDGVLSREMPEAPFQFDWRQLRRWGVDEASVPPGSVILDRPPGFWEVYRWRILAVLGLCVVEAILILGLLMERASRLRARVELRRRQEELRSLTGRLIHVQEEERRRIARELHDDLNQNLALLAIELDLLAQTPPGSDEKLAGRLRDLAGRVRQLSSDVHDLSHHLHPSTLEQLGLGASIRSLCRGLARENEIAIAFEEREPPPSVPADAILCLYRISQEALQNVLKHSGARQARVELAGDGRAVALRVEDDGVGFDSEMSGATRGLGLVSMRERLHLVGGSLSIESRPGRGTTIEVRIPLRKGSPRGRESASPSIDADL